ncbi:MAG: flagella basal body P-ring formation protein FlgA [Bacteriovoracaceae bacterium]
MKLLLLSLILFSFHSMACEVTLPHHLVILNETTVQEKIDFKTCAKEQEIELTKTIINLNGRMNSSQLSEILGQRELSNIKIKNHSFEIEHLKNILRQNLELPSGVQIKNIYGPSISLAPGDRIELYCPQCLFGDKQPLEVRILGFDGSLKTTYAQVDFKKMVRAYRVLSPLQSFSNIEYELNLKEEFVESIPYTDLVTDLEQLKFFKTNKPIAAGSLLRRSDLNAVSIVKAGLKTEVIFENQQVRIKTSGISRSSGGIGDLVEVFHPQKNKKYQGKVIDINKVLVEL